MKCRIFAPIGLLLIATLSPHASAVVTAAPFGKMPDGAEVTLFTITNGAGSAAKIMTYGATVVSLIVPDRNGKLADVVLGFDDLTGYLRSSPYFGAVVGRYANRIANAQFSLDGVQYHLEPNERGNTLHGGRRGFDKVLWTAMPIDDQTVEFTCLSKDGEGGFPGNLSVTVRYSLSEANELKIDYAAATDKPTVLNLTNHSYFNLAGQGAPDVLSHRLMIDADRYTPANATLIPTGKIEPLADTPFDFTRPREIGERLNDPNEQLKSAGGYDENFVLIPRDGLRFAARISEPTTGRVMEVWTTQPAIQFYSGNGLNPRLVGKGGKSYPRHSAFCLEPQHFPDSPNQPSFPTTELKPGDTYHQITVYKFITPVGVDLSSGWKLLQTGDGQASIEMNAKHPTNTDPHLLLISVTKTPERGKGRAGATNNVAVSVEQDHWYDITFTAATERGSIGLVFSLESADGKVLARTTLPEIGRAGRGGPATRVTGGIHPVWPTYLVTLHARASDVAAHLVITPLDPTNMWLDNLKLTPRAYP